MRTLRPRADDALRESDERCELDATRLYEVTAAVAAARDVDAVLDLITAEAVEAVAHGAEKGLVELGEEWNRLEEQGFDARLGPVGRR